MAMEHFDEKIAPMLKAKMPAVALYPFGSTDSCACPDEPQQSKLSLKLEPPHQKTNHMRKRKQRRRTAMQ